MTKILIVDDDASIACFVADFLEMEGYRTQRAADGVEALHALAEAPLDLAIVDVMMPRMDGYTLTSKIRQQYDIPILLLTAKSRIQDKEKGYMSGTDDYLSKPFEPQELIFRVRALLRRYNKEYERVIRVGDLEINRNSYEIHAEAQTLLIPLKEFELLCFLATHVKQVFSREHLIEKIWGADYEGDERTVDVHIKRLRQRLANITNNVLIKTVRGVGYALEISK